MYQATCTPGMDRLQRVMRLAARRAGAGYEEARRAYHEGRAVPRDTDSARIVCRRYAERRQVRLDDNERPDCFDADHPACRGCVEDIRNGCVETW
jgi:hypothetical protein